MILSLENSAKIANVLVEGSSVHGQCWLWNRGKTGSGYGVYAVARKPYLVHRLSYELFNGQLPKNKSVCHSCDTPSCINPEHLWVGTQSDNILDCYSKGRFPTRRAERCWNAVLTFKKAEEIRKLMDTGEYSQRGLAKKLGISYTTVREVVNNRRWTPSL